MTAMLLVYFLLLGILKSTVAFPTRKFEPRQQHEVKDRRVFTSNVLLFASTSHPRKKRDKQIKTSLKLSLPQIPQHTTKKNTISEKNVVRLHQENQNLVATQKPSKNDKKWNGTKHEQPQSTSAYDFNHWLQRLVRANAPKVQLAEKALWQRIETYDHDELANCRKPPYDTISFNIVLNGWAQQRSLYAAQKADDLLHKLLQLQQFQSHLQADAYSYSAVLNAYSKSKGGKAAALRAEELLVQMQNSFPYHGQGNSRNNTAGSDVPFNAVIDAWSVSGDPQAGKRAEKWLRKMDYPSRISYNACIKAYARSQAPVEAQRLLKEMQTLSRSSGDLELEPDKISISTCIDAWSKWTKNATIAACKAEALLLEMEREFEEWNQTKVDHAQPRRRYHMSKGPRFNKQPDVFTYTSVLTAYARSGIPGASNKALELIRRMEKYSDERPNAPFFNTFIHLLGKSPRSSSNGETPEQIAEAILQHMKRQYQETQDWDMRPCKITYTAVISVYASHCEDYVAAGERSEALLDELEEIFNETKNEAFLPNTKTFGAVLSVLAKTTLSGDCVWDRAERLLQRMECLYQQTYSEDLKPTSILYSQLFRILANGRDPNAASRGLALMKKIKSIAGNKDKQFGYGEHVILDSTMYAYLIVTFTKSKVENVIELATQILEEVEEGYKAGMGDLKPSSLLYSAVLQAYAKSASKKGASLAEQLLERTKSMYMQGKLYAKPTTLFYNAVMDAHARSNGGREAAERAETLLDEMEARGRVGDSELCLTTRSFNAAILAWKNSNVPDAPERAEALLKRMNLNYKSGDESCRPDRVTLNSIIGVWAKSQKEGAAVRAEEFLRFMDGLQKPGDPMKADRYSYNTVIDAYSRSSDIGAARRAQAVYERMKKLSDAGQKDMKPDLITLTSLRKAWIASDDADADVYLRVTEEEIMKEMATRRQLKQTYNADSAG